jgi:hypothetical protein
MIRGPVFREFGHGPVDRGDPHVAASTIDTGVALLAAGKAGGIYPEGTHSPHGQLHKSAPASRDSRALRPSRSAWSAWPAPAGCPFYESSTRAARPSARRCASEAATIRPQIRRQATTIRRALSLRPFGLVGATRS